MDGDVHPETGDYDGVDNLTDHLHQLYDHSLPPPLWEEYCGGTFQFHW